MSGGLIGFCLDAVQQKTQEARFHPQVVGQDGKVCLYTQDMYRVGKTEGECLTPVPWKFYRGDERPGA